MKTTYDVAIVGSGFASSILARALNQRGQRVVLIERGRHPRFTLGESTTPLANFALERLARRYDLPDLRQLSTHGRWLRHLPHLRRGLKRGFTFYKHRPDEPFCASPRNENRLLVAASPDNEIADTHWLRSDVDHHLVERAIDEGVELYEDTELVGVSFSQEGATLEGRRHGEPLHFEAGYLIDGSGPGGFLAQHLPLDAGPLPDGVASGLLFSHFAGLEPFAADAGLAPGPYPDEQAAVHHLLEEGWMYVLPFDHGTASAGIVLRGRRQIAEALEEPERGWKQLLARYPSLVAQFADARPQFPIRCLPRIQHRSRRAVGQRWFLLPHAFAFFDPMFSTGMAQSLLAVERLAGLLCEGHGSRELYEDRLQREADQIERLIESAYLASGNFECFTALTFLYFATVSFAEVQQRLGDDSSFDAWAPFLGAGDSEKETLFEDVRDRLRSHSGSPSDDQARSFQRFVMNRIASFDLIGLGLPELNNLYSVDLDILIERAPLLGMEREAMTAALPRLRGAALD